MADEADTLERPQVDQEKESAVKHKAEETFEMNGAYIAEQAREAMRVFFLPMSSVVRAARAKSRSVKRDVRRSRDKAA
jgi:hypothetical protein